MDYNLKAALSVTFLAAVFLGTSILPPDALASRNVNVNRNVSRNTTRTNINRNVNVNRNVNRDVHVHTNRHVDIDVHNRYHPVATAAAVTATTIVTAAVVGSMVRTLPPSCSMVQVNNVVYQQCGSTWYQPQYVGSSVQYIVINPPR